MKVNNKILSNSIESAQKRIEESNFKRRKHVLTYDDVMNQQRTVIYNQRRSVLDGEDISATIRGMIDSTIREAVASFTQGESSADWNLDALRSAYLGYLCKEDDFKYTESEMHKLKSNDIAEMLCERAEKLYFEKEVLFGEAQMREIERAILLRNVDLMWMEHIDAMDELKGQVGFQAYAQRDPVTEYRIQGADMFDAMVADIRERTVRTILSIQPAQQESTVRRVQVAKPLNEGFEGNGPASRKVVKRSGPEPIRNTQTPGRNDPCPCGSGKKYKKCCGAGQGGGEQ